MTREEVKSCLAVINSNYKQCYKEYSDAEMSLLIDIWLIQFASANAEDVKKAIVQYIGTGRFAPTVADIKEILLNRIPRLSDEEVWELVKKAGRNGLYASEEEWAKLPEQIRRAITPNTILEIARSDNDSLGWIKKDVLTAYHSVENKDRTNNAVLLGDRRMKLTDFEHLMIGENDVSK